MKHHYISVGLTAAFLLLSASLSSAIENKTNAPQTATSNANAKSKIDRSDIDAKRKAHANIRLININGATREQLKKLPGISNAESDRIIAGRPYATKAHLVTQNIIARGVYENLKKLIIAKQPYKDGAKNAALYNNKKK